jgi:hypothetical protein
MSHCLTAIFHHRALLPDLTPLKKLRILLISLKMTLSIDLLEENQGEIK